MSDLETQNMMLYLVIVIIIIGSLICLLCTFQYLANNYIKKNQEKLFNIKKDLALKCNKLGDLLLRGNGKFINYIKELGLDKTIKCSNSIVSNASNNITKYILKYSSIENDISSVEKIDYCTDYIQLLNDFHHNIDDFYSQVKLHLPVFVKMFATKWKIPYLICRINYKITEYEEPEFKFLYVSPAGKSSNSCKINISVNVLKSLQTEIYNKMKKNNYSQIQRNTMTKDLREAIKKRDNYTCCICGNSVLKEPNLLLEVDHIIPISKGGKTEESNLQTLCWRCNRNKSNKLQDDEV